MSPDPVKTFRAWGVGVLCLLLSATIQLGASILVQPICQKHSLEMLVMTTCFCLDPDVRPRHPGDSPSNCKAKSREAWLLRPSLLRGRTALYVRPGQRCCTLHSCRAPAISSPARPSTCPLAPMPNHLTKSFTPSTSHSPISTHTHLSPTPCSPPSRDVFTTTHAGLHVPKHHTRWWLVTPHLERERQAATQRECWVAARYTKSPNLSLVATCAPSAHCHCNSRALFPCRPGCRPAATVWSILPHIHLLLPGAACPVFRSISAACSAALRLHPSTGHL